MKITPPVTTCCGSTPHILAPERWLTLPVAPRANNRIRFASTQESSPAMTPAQALVWLGNILSTGEKIAGVNIAGPGDPLAESGPTLETLRLVGEKYPAMVLGITTLGLGWEQMAERLVQAGVSHVTLLVDGVDLEVVRKLYAWIRPGAKTVPLATAAELLLDEQAKAAAGLLQAGCTVHVRTVVYPGYNDEHMENIARTMAALGVKSMSVVPFDPASAGEDMLERPSHEMMTGIGNRVGQYITTILEKVQPAGAADGLARNWSSVTSMRPRPSTDRPNVAVVSSNGLEVDLHLGQAGIMLIYGPREDGLVCLLEKRIPPEPGTGVSRWEIMAATLKDCFVLLAASAGENPLKVLSSHGLSVLITTDNIEGAVEVLYGGEQKGMKCRK